MVDEIQVPNAITLKTFEDTDAGRNLVRVENAGEMFELLGI